MKITFYLPHLLAPVVQKMAPYSPQEYPALGAWQKQAIEKKQIAVARDISSQLCALFGISPDRSGDYPIAALSLLQDAPAEAASGIWMRADPVYLHTEPNGLLLYESSTFSSPVVTDAEADAISAQRVAAVQQHLAQYEMALLVAHPQRWYVRLPQVMAARTWEPGAVNGQNIRHYLPQGKEQAFWHRLQNEIQMLLHNINQHTLSASSVLPLVNSVWFWGQGCLPQEHTCCWTAVYADDRLAKALAEHCHIPCHPLNNAVITGDTALPGETEDLLFVLVPDGDGKIADTQCDSAATCLQVLQQEWLQPVLSLRKHHPELQFRVVTETSWYEMQPRTGLRWLQRFFPSS